MTNSYLVMCPLTGWLTVAHLHKKISKLKISVTVAIKASLIHAYCPTSFVNWDTVCVLVVISPHKVNNFA